MKTNHFITVFLMANLVSFQLFAAGANTEVCDWPKIKKLESGNPISTYTFDYWNFAGKNLSKYFNKNQDLLQAGPVVGDYHFNNVGIYYNQKTKQTDLAIIDLDDSGEASYFADYLKFLAYLKTVNKSVDQKDLLKSYIKGLSTKNLKDIGAPKKVQDYFTKESSWFDANNQKAVLKKTNSDQTKFGKNEDLKSIATLSSDINEMVKGLKAGVRTLDVGYKVNVSGSSKDSLRVWMLNEDANKKLSIYEFKELRCAGVSRYQPQDDQVKRFATMKKAFNSEQFWGASYIDSAFDHTKNANTYFLLRKKQENPLQDLEIDHMKSDDLKEYANYYAYLLGFYHGKTASQSYVNVFDKEDRKEILQVADVYSSDYIKRLEDKMKK